MSENNLISKKKLWRYINIKLKRSIHQYHVFGVINILFDEMKKDFKNGKVIKIRNFATFNLKQMKDRRYHNVWTRQFMDASGGKVLRLIFTKPLRKKLCELVGLTEK